MSKGVQQASAWTLSLGLHSLVVLGLIWGMRWTQHPEPMGAQAELWQTLAEPEAMTLPTPPVPPLAMPVMPPVPQPTIAFKATKRIPKKHPTPLVKKQEHIKTHQRITAAPPKSASAQASISKEEINPAPNHSLASIGASRHGATAASKPGKSSVGLGGWERQARQRIRRKIQLPDALEGNPEAIFEVTLSRSMDVLQIRQVKSSGFPEYDAAVREAIEQVGSFPNLPDENFFSKVQRTRLKFRPRE